MQRTRRDTTELMGAVPRFLAYSRSRAGRSRLADLSVESRSQQSAKHLAPACNPGSPTDLKDRRHIYTHASPLCRRRHAKVGAPHGLDDIDRPIPMYQDPAQMYSLFTGYEYFPVMNTSSSIPNHITPAPPTPLLEAFDYPMSQQSFEEILMPDLSCSSSPTVSDASLPTPCSSPRNPTRIMSVYDAYSSPEKPQQAYAIAHEDPMDISTTDCAAELIDDEMVLENEFENDTPESLRAPMDVDLANTSSRTSGGRADISSFESTISAKSTEWFSEASALQQRIHQLNAQMQLWANDVKFAQGVQHVNTPTHSFTRQYAPPSCPSVDGALEDFDLDLLGEDAKTLMLTSPVLDSRDELADYESDVEQTEVESEKMAPPATQPSESLTRSGLVLRITNPWTKARNCTVLTEHEASYAPLDYGEMAPLMAAMAKSWKC